MPSLLVTPYHPAGSELLSSIASASLAGQRMEQEQQARAQSMAAELIRSVEAQRRYDDRRAFDREMQDRIARHQAVADQRDAQRLQLERDKFDLLKADQEPFTFNGGATPSIPATTGGSTEGVDLWTAGNPSTPSEGLLNLDATGYHPYDVRNDKERKMEGGKTDSKGNPIYTLEMYQRGEAPYVTAAVPQGSDLFGKTLASPDLPGVPIKASDHFGTLGGKLIQGPRIDIATDNRSMASKLTGPMRFTLADTVAPASPVKSVPAEPSIPAAPAAQTPSQQLASMAQMLQDAGARRGEGRKMLLGAIPRLVAPRTAASTKPERLVFPDKSLREKNPATGEWEILGEKPTVDTTEKTARAEESQLMQRIRLEQSNLKPLESKLARIEKDGKKPSWPWEEGGKLYKMDGESRKEIDRQEFDKLTKQSNNTEWAKINDQAEKRRQKIAELESGLGQQAPGAPTSTPTAQPDLKTLAQKALEDPTASPAHKEAARRILGQLSQL